MRVERLPERFDVTRPENKSKVDAAIAFGDLAAQAGITLIELAIAFVPRHPAVTSAIIGPRTLAHLESQLTAADVTLDSATLDRIDEIVPPGVNVNQSDGGWISPALLQPALRRR